MEATVPFRPNPLELLVKTGGEKPKAGLVNLEAVNAFCDPSFAQDDDLLSLAQGDDESGPLLEGGSTG